MVFTNYGLSGLAITGFTGSGTPPSWLGIGSGSGTIGITTSGIMNEYSDQRVKYTTRDPATQKQVEWTYDKGATSMSGLTLTNFGMYSTSSGGNIWNIHSIGSVVFDGTVELQFNLKIKNE